VDFAFLVKKTLRYQNYFASKFLKLSAKKRFCAKNNFLAKKVLGGWDGFK
jgi:hypothetical protein